MKVHFDSRQRNAHTPFANSKDRLWSVAHIEVFLCFNKETDLAINTNQTNAPYRNSYHNMTNHYYLCSSQTKHRGLGCGASLHVRQDETEEEVFIGLHRMLRACADPRGFTRLVNAEIRKIYEEANGYDPQSAQEFAEIERRIENIRQATVNGLDDITWANAEMQRLRAEKEALEKVSVLTGKPPQLDVKAAMAYREQIEHLHEQDDPATKRAIIRDCVSEVSVYPELLEAEADYRFPLPLIKIDPGAYGAGVYSDGRYSGGRI
ncbi:MAG: hypothetical protein ACYC6A_11565 [Armatimonadota bacterium]